MSVCPKCYCPPSVPLFFVGWRVGFLDSADIVFGPPGARGNILPHTYTHTKTHIHQLYRKGMLAIHACCLSAFTPTANINPSFWLKEGQSLTIWRSLPLPGLFWICSTFIIFNYIFMIQVNISSFFFGKDKFRFPMIKVKVYLREIIWLFFIEIVKTPMEEKKMYLNIVIFFNLVFI